MIGRIWHGYTTQANADAYEALLKSEIFAGIRGRNIPGFQEIQLFRRDLGMEVEFITVMWFDSIEAVRIFAGVDYETGLKAVEELRALLPAGWSMPQFALRWILMYEAVTCTIPGAKNPAQAEDNAAAADLPDLNAVTMEKIRAIYDARIRRLVHHYW